MVRAAWIRSWLRVLFAVGAVALVPVAAAADGPAGPRPLPGAPPVAPGSPGRPPSPSQRALEHTIVHGQIESDRARRKLQEIQRRSADSASAKATSPSSIPGVTERHVTPLPVESQIARSRERLRVDQDIADVERILARPGLGPTTRSTLERYHQELLADRTRLQALPSPDAQ